MNILIDTIRVAGYRGIKNLDVSLPRITVLIGTTNSGKTSLIKTLHLATAATRIESQHQSSGCNICSI